MKRVLALLATLIISTSLLLTTQPAQATIAVAPILTGPISVDRYAYSYAQTVKRAAWETPSGATIRADQFLINLPDVREALLSAYSRGVHLQVVMDNDAARGADLPGSTARQYNFLARALGTNRSNRSWVYLCRASCFSDVKGANMHAKTALFSQTGTLRHVSIIGSANLAFTNTMASWNESMVYTDVNLYLGLVSYHNAMAQDKVRPWGKHLVSKNRQVEMWLYPGVPDVVQRDLNGINSCVGVSIDISNFIWSDGAVRKATRLRELWLKGCKVRVALNYSSPTPHVGVQVAKILSTPDARGRRMNVRDARPSNCCYSHLKLTLIKTPTRVAVYGGSANFTGSNRRINADILTVDRRGSVYNQYVAYFTRMFNGSTKPVVQSKATSSKTVSDSAMQ
jgi:hypothetical protein